MELDNTRTDGHTKLWNSHLPKGCYIIVRKIMRIIYFATHSIIIDLIHNIKPTPLSISYIFNYVVLKS